MTSDDNTPVRTPSGTHRIGLVPCPKCKRALVPCDLCVDDQGRPARYVAVDVAVRWSVEHDS